MATRGGLVAGLALAALAAGAGAQPQEERPAAPERPARVQREGAQACVFPALFQGSEVFDCVEWNDAEWCKNAAGLWGICAPAAAPAEDAAQPAAAADEAPTGLDALELIGSGGGSGGSGGGSSGGGGAAAPAVVLNEVLASPGKGEKDWVELFNPGARAVDLQGWTLCDAGTAEADEGCLTLGEAVCQEMTKSLGPGEYLVLERDAPCSFEFGIGEPDELLLRDRAGALVDSARWGGDAHVKGLALGRLDGAEKLQLTVPTKGKPNKKAPASLVAERAPEHTDAKGACCAALAEIGFKSEVPVIIINTRGRKVPDEPKVPTEFCTCTPGGNSLKDYKGYAGVETRGNSSQRLHKKKSMAVELWNATGSDTEFGLLDFPKEEDWILYGPESDRTMGLRNHLAFHLAREMGRYASRARHVEVFLQDDGLPLSRAHYHGIFMLQEKIKRGEKRVDICKHKPDDMTGGYIIKHDNDNISPDDVVFAVGSSRRDAFGPLIRMVLRDPDGDPDDLAEELQYLTNYFNDFEAALGSPTFANPQTGWRQFANESSFIDFFLATEITKNPDSYRGSTFMYKDCEKPLEMGPMWDYNEAFGICCGYPFEGYDKGGESDGQSGGSAISPNGWRFNICADEWRCEEDPLDGVSRWFMRIWEDPKFKAAAARRWAELRKGSLSTENVKKEIFEVVGEIRPAVMRNFKRWDREADLVGGYGSAEERWDHEVTELTTWLVQRLAWMDKELAKFNIRPAATSG